MKNVPEDVKAAALTGGGFFCAAENFVRGYNLAFLLLMVLKAPFNARKRGQTDVRLRPEPLQGAGSAPWMPQSGGPEKQQRYLAMAGSFEGEGDGSFLLRQKAPPRPLRWNADFVQRRKEARPPWGRASLWLKGGELL